MLRLGKALHLSSSHSLILRFENAELRGIGIGMRVLDAKGKEVGVVQDVFGPVKRPYLSIRPRVSNANELVGRELFLRER